MRIVNLYKALLGNLMFKLIRPSFGVISPID